MGHSTLCIPAYEVASHAGVDIGGASLTFYSRHLRQTQQHRAGMSKQLTGACEPSASDGQLVGVRQALHLARRAKPERGRCELAHYKAADRTHEDVVLRQVGKRLLVRPMLRWLRRGRWTSASTLTDAMVSKGRQVLPAVHATVSLGCELSIWTEREWGSPVIMRLRFHRTRL